MKLSVLVDKLQGAELAGEDLEVNTICEPGGRGDVELWLEGPVETTKPVITDSEFDLKAEVPVVTVPDLESRLPRVLEEFERGSTGWGITSGARVEDDFKYVDHVFVGHGAWIGRNVSVGEEVHISAGVTISGDVQIGDNVYLHPGVRIESPAVIGDNTVIHANTVIGSDGFGFQEKNGNQQKIPQVGRVEIGKNVEIGPCSTIDRATYGVTRIGDGSKLDDQVHIAHNCEVGENCVIAGKTGFSGSVTLGDKVTLGGTVAISDHVAIADGVTVAGRAGVTKDISEEGVVVSGFPARPHREELRRQASVRRIPELKERIKKLEEKV